MTFLETSALTGENVEEIFLKTARSILAKIEAGICSVHNGTYMCINHGCFILQESWIQRGWDQVFNLETDR